VPVHIHQTAIVDPSAKLGEDVHVGAYSIIEADCEIGDGCRIQPHAVLHSRTVIGENTFVDCHAVLGGNPNFLGFDPSLSSGVRIGKSATIRESTTVHRSILADGYTEIGDHFFLMPNAHIGHDCSVGDHVVLANNCLLGGHVQAGDHVFLGGGAAVHQFCRVGEGVMIGGHASVSLDVAPYTTLANRNEIHGINLIGLRRRKVDRESIMEIKALYRLLLQSNGRAEEKAAKIPPPKTREGQNFLLFFKDSHRGYAKSTRAT